jgi:addiction module HigA family antidote
MARTPIHPGEILSDELKELNMSARDMAAVLNVPASRLYQIIAGKRSLTADTALRLARYFGTSPELWMNLQTMYELDLARRENGAAIKRIPQRKTQTTSPTLKEWLLAPEPRFDHLQELIPPRRGYRLRPPAKKRLP